MGEVLDVLGHHVGAAPDQSERPGGDDECEGAAGRGAHERVLVPARGRDQLDRVVADRLLDVHVLDRALEREEVLRVQDLGDLLLLPAPIDAARDHAPFLLGRGIAERQPQQEAVQLRLG